MPDWNKELLSDNNKDIVIAALKILLERQEISTLELGEDLNIGYANCCHLIDKLYFAGIVSRPGSDWCFENDKEMLKPIELILNPSEKQKVQECIDQTIL